MGAARKRNIRLCQTGHQTGFFIRFINHHSSCLSHWVSDFISRYGKMQNASFEGIVPIYLH
jgi:hypothetical protein